MENRYREYKSTYKENDNRKCLQSDKFCKLFANGFVVNCIHQRAEKENNKRTTKWWRHKTKE